MGYLSTMLQKVPWVRFLTAFLVLNSTFLCAQSWLKLYGDSTLQGGQDIVQLHNGHHVVLGVTEKQGEMDILLMELDFYGDTIWEKTFGGVFRDYAGSVIQTPDGGYLICGTKQISTNLNPESDIWIIKTDERGDLEWEKSFAYQTWSKGYEAISALDSGYVILGHSTFGVSNGVISILHLIKVNDHGDTIWTKEISSSTALIAGVSLSKLNSNAYILSGTYYEPQTDVQEAYLAKVHASGDTLWSKRYGGVNLILSESVKQTPDFGFILTGTIGKYDRSMYLIKTDSAGIEEWNWTKTSSKYSAGTDVIISSDQNIVTVGYSDTSIVLMKLALSGGVIWTKEYGIPGKSLEGSSLIEAQNGGFLITGTVRGGNANGPLADIVVLKTDSYGNLKLMEHLSNQNSNSRKLLGVYGLNGMKLKSIKNNEPHIRVYDDGSFEKLIKVD